MGSEEEAASRGRIYTKFERWVCRNRGESAGRMVIMSNPGKWQGFSVGNGRPCLGSKITHDRPFTHRSYLRETVGGEK